LAIGEKGCCAIAPLPQKSSCHRFNYPKGDRVIIAFMKLPNPELAVIDIQKLSALSPKLCYLGQNHEEKPARQGFAVVSS
jgi:hypothetical protein